MSADDAARRPQGEPPCVIRAAAPSDLKPIAMIYAHHVLSGFGTFEEAPPTVAEMTARHAMIVASGLPYLVADIAGAVAGYAYASMFRPRSAYRYAVEDSIYVAPERLGQGVGRRLLAALIDACEAQGFRHMIAVIGYGDNQSSIWLHRSLGFVDGGMLRGVGYKHDRWVDAVLMQRPLGPGAAAPPAGPAIHRKGLMLGN